MKTRNTVSGSSTKCGNLGVSATPNPPRTSSVGKGMPVRSASKRNPATTANNKSMTVMADTLASYSMWMEFPRSISLQLLRFQHIARPWNGKPLVIIRLLTNVEL